jgi:hypothetical protein
MTGRFILTACGPRAGPASRPKQAEGQLRILGTAPLVLGSDWARLAGPA